MSYALLDLAKLIGKHKLRPVCKLRLSAAVPNLESGKQPGSPANAVRQTAWQSDKQPLNAGGQSSYPSSVARSIMFDSA